MEWDTTGENVPVSHERLGEILRDFRAKHRNHQLLKVGDYLWCTECRETLKVLKSVTGEIYVREYDVKTLTITLRQ